MLIVSQTDQGDHASDGELEMAAKRAGAAAADVLST
jgi:hypothetical protein